MDVILTLAGAALILYGLVDIFRTLLHPRGQGHLTGTTLEVAWRLSRATGHRAGSAVGAAAMVATILLWVALQVAGWALVYLPHLPAGFSYSSGVDPATHPQPLEAVYVSLVTLATLGLGDVVPTASGIRYLVPVEALTGFALLTAALTWFMQIDPTLARRRALALELHGLARSGAADALDATPPAEAARIIDTVASAVVTAGVDCAHHPEGLYFQESTEHLSLAAQLPHALALRVAGEVHPDPAVRRSATRLRSALDALAEHIASGFTGPRATAEDVFESYAREHRRRG